MLNVFNYSRFITSTHCVNTVPRDQPPLHNEWTPESQERMVVDNDPVITADTKCEMICTDYDTIIRVWYDVENDVTADFTPAEFLRLCIKSGRIAVFLNMFKTPRSK